MLPLNIPLGRVFWGNLMDTRYFLSAFAGLFVAVTIFATVTTVRHVINPPVARLRAAENEKAISPLN
jgi:hypothetical protein